MYRENDILTELFNALGMSKEDIKAFKDECRDCVTSKNASEIKQSETPKKQQPKKEDTRTTSSEPRDGYVRVEDSVDYESPKCEDTVATYEPQAQNIAKDVVSIGNSYFELNKHAGNAILGGDVIKIEFEDSFEDLTFPGITNKQLLWVLYVRYMKDHKKLSLVKQLLATEF